MTTAAPPVIITEVAELAAPSPRVTGGVLFNLNLGVTLPASANDPLDPSFIKLGRVSSDGVDRTEERGNVEIQDWGGNLVAVLQDKYGLTIKFKLLQAMNADVQRAAHGSGNVTVTPPTASTGTEIAAKLNQTLLDNGVWVFDGFYNKINMRLVIPYGRITLVGPMKWTHKELVMYDMTLKPLPDNSNNHGYQYWNDGITTLGLSATGQAVTKKAA
jgi:hypothetical protein